MNHRRWAARLLGSLLLVAQFGALGSPPSGQRPDAAPAGSQFNIAGPLKSGQFGAQVATLSNGNILIFDPAYDSNKGAVYLYNGATHMPISHLTGTQPGDQVGSGGFQKVNDSTLLIFSPHWANGFILGSADSGAVTWFNTATGVTGVVSSTNSLVGRIGGSFVGSGGATILANGNVVIDSPDWDDVTASFAGAVTWANGTTGLTGSVSAANSLVGDANFDEVGFDGVIPLSNGNYVVVSSRWRSGGVFANSLGAVTWGNGATGTAGAVGGFNSLVGSHPGDQVGLKGVTRLTNNLNAFLVDSYDWANVGAANAGAVTWVNGNTGAGGTGVVGATNSLVGSHTGDTVGSDKVVGLDNGNYLVLSSVWANGGASVGAVTWGNGLMAISGPVSTTNSLVGTHDGDAVGLFATELDNGQVVIRSPDWANVGAPQAGAATFADSAAPIIGLVSPANSLVGSHNGDRVSSGGVTPLANGNYVVESPDWANSGNTKAGAVTWGNGNTGTTGVVTTTNSLVGSQVNDQAGSSGVKALNTANGAYLVRSPNWKNGGAAKAGAVTLADGTSGISAVVTTTNSLVGDQVNDRVGSDPISMPTFSTFVIPSPHWHGNQGAVTFGNAATGLMGLISPSNSLVGGHPKDQLGFAGIRAGFYNGSYVVSSPLWANGPITQTGAVTWGNGTTNATGVVSSTNSLVGTQTGDQVSSDSVGSLSDDSYVVVSPDWANCSAQKAGAVSLLPGTGPSSGPINSSNSVLGLATNGGSGLNWVFDCVNKQLVVGRPADNIVTLFSGVASCRYTVNLPLIAR